MGTYYEIMEPVMSWMSQQICRTTDGAVIPEDPENSDYNAYLQWVAAGHTAWTYVNGDTYDPSTNVIPTPSRPASS